MARKPHLADLFNKGETITIVDASDVEYEIFVRRPDPNQHQTALDAGNAKLASITVQYESRSGPRYDSIAAMVRAEPDKDVLIDQLVQYELSDVRQQAYHEVLYGDAGSVWDGEDEGRSYLDVLQGINARAEEIIRYNETIDEDDRLDQETDEMMTSLLEAQTLFQSEVAVREGELMLDVRVKHQNKPVAQLQNELIKAGLEVEGKLYWYEEYQTKLLYYACREPDDVKQLYFDNPYDILELPQYIRALLYEAYERLELGSDELKNSLSLPVS